MNNHQLTVFVWIAMTASILNSIAIIILAVKDSTP